MAIGWEVRLDDVVVGKANFLGLVADQECKAFRGTSRTDDSGHHN
jgi:hypothetical protein